MYMGYIKQMSALQESSIHCHLQSHAANDETDLRTQSIGLEEVLDLGVRILGAVMEVDTVASVWLDDRLERLRAWYVLLDLRWNVGDGWVAGRQAVTTTVWHVML